MLFLVFENDVCVLPVIWGTCHPECRSTGLEIEYYDSTITSLDDFLLLPLDGLLINWTAEARDRPPL